MIMIMLVLLQVNLVMFAALFFFFPSIQKNQKYYSTDSILRSNKC